MAKDIDHLKKVQARLQQSERRLNEAQKIANIGSWELDLSNLEDVNANPLYWSDQVFRIFGYEPGEIKVSNENFFNAVHPDDREKIKAAVDQTLETGQDYDIEHRILLPSGEERIVQERSHVLLDPENGKPIFLAGTVQDITDQKKIMHQLIEAQKMESIGRLAGGIAHDFNNMLASIYGSLELMEREISPDHSAHSQMKSLQTTAKRAAELTSQLLAFSRQQILSPSHQDLNVLVGEAHKILSRLIEKNIDIRLHLGQPVGAIEVDSTQIIQIILNLAINARDAMPGGGTLDITTGEVQMERTDPLRPQARPGRYAFLRVRDSGHGMDNDTLEKIFEPFFTTKKPGTGTGLGLSTVYGIVQQSGGIISVQSRVNQGSTFEIWFPLSTRLTPSVPVSIVPPRAPVVAGKNQLILVVEDEAELRTILQQTLELAGYRVLLAENGRTGLQMIESQGDHIDLLITDIILPGASGIDLIKTLRQSRPHLPVICVSGYSSADMRASLDLANVTFMQKPFHFSALTDQIHQLLMKKS